MRKEPLHIFNSLKRDGTVGDYNSCFFKTHIIVNNVLFEIKNFQLTETAQTGKKELIDAINLRLYDLIKW